MVRFLLAAIIVCGAMLDAAPGSAWGYKGHRVAGSIADQLLNANARQQVAQALGFDLRLSGPWLDCVKSVAHKADGTFAYTENPDHPEYEIPCTSFRTPDEQKRMEDYVGRNWFGCRYPPAGTERGCHNTYHFDDVAIQRDRFDRNYQGTNEHDLVAAINASIAVLLGRPSPLPFSIKDKKEALFLLAHLVGDIHQPLHVASAYLTKDGRLVDPDLTHTIDPASETAGGNLILENNTNFHAEWDDIPADLGEAATPELMSLAKAVVPNEGRVENWSYAWATDTISVGQDAFFGVTFAASPDGRRWVIAYDDKPAYLRKQDMLKRQQLAKAGARFANLLNTIWP